MTFIESTLLWCKKACGSALFVHDLTGTLARPSIFTAGGQQQLNWQKQSEREKTTTINNFTEPKKASRFTKKAILMLGTCGHKSQVVKSQVFFSSEDSSQVWVKIKPQTLWVYQRVTFVGAVNGCLIILQWNTRAELTQNNLRMTQKYKSAA